MATYQEDSTDDEIGMNLQLAERLSINRGDHASTNNNSLNKKDNRHLYKSKKMPFLDEQSSSSSSLEMQNDPSLVQVTSVYNLHNKKRQNGDKNTEQCANPKRTCLSDRFNRAQDHKSKSNGDTSQSSLVATNFSSQPTNDSRRNLFPDSTYEEHLNKFSDNEDSDFQVWRRFPYKKKGLDTGENSQALQNFGPSSSSLHPLLEENRASVSHGVHFVDSASDDDSRNVMQNGALKGGRQSPEPMSFKKVLGRKVKKVLDSDDSDDDDNWPVNYRNRRVLFLSSDSDDSRPSNKINKPTDTTLKKSANLSFSSGDSYNSSHDHVYHKSDGSFINPFAVNSCSDYMPHLEPTTSSYKGKNRSNKSYKTRSSNRAERQVEFEPDFEFHSYRPKDYHADTDESHSRGPSIPHSRNLRSHRHDESNKSLKSRSHNGTNSQKQKSHHTHHRDSTEADHSNRTNVADMSPSHSAFDDYHPRENRAHSMLNRDFHPANEDETNVRRRATMPRTARSHRRINSSKAAKGRTLNEACPFRGKSNLATRYPDLFDAEDSSEVEFFTANSYSDNESNTESLNDLRRINPLHRHTPVHIQEVGNLDSVNVGSSEDEISVVFTSGPHPRNNDQRRGAARTLGRRSNRGSRRHVTNTQDVVSLSPDPVEQVRQMEEDERFARMLQAQFDAETDPTYLPRSGANVCQTPNPCPMTTREVTSSDDSIDLHFGTDVYTSNPSERFITITPFSLLPTISLPRRGSAGSYRGRRARRRAAELDARFNLSHLFAASPLPNFLSYDSSDDSYEAFLGIAELSGDVAHGLQKAEINRLPTRKYIAPNPSSSSNGADMPHKRAELNKECQVCLSDYVNGDVLRILPCFHEFHTPCIDPWLKINHTCPVCRVIVDLGE